MSRQNMDNSVKPRHVAFIMDGNGRWAERRHLPRVLGHREGAKALERAVRFGVQEGLPYLSFFAFSTENWRRPAEEVEGLMKLFRQTLSDKTAELAEQGIRLRFCGRIGDLPADIRENIEKAEKITSSLDRMQLIICMNYGGRQEILDAAAKAFANDVSYLDERSFREYLYLPDVPDPDLIIRTSGEMRLSNFFLWQASYAELYFTDVLWPDFDEKDFIDALLAYSKRKRRYGATEGFQK